MKTFLLLFVVCFLFVAPVSAQSLTASPATLALTGNTGSAASTQAVVLTATSDSVAISAITSDQPSWLTASVTGGSFTVTANAPATLTISANPTRLAAGVYIGHITVAPGTGPTITITVTFTVGAASGSGVGANPASLSFTAPVGQTSPSQNLTISNGSSTPVLVTVGSDVSWIAAQVVSGNVNSVASNSPAVLSVSANASNLASGTYTGHLAITPSIGDQIVVTVTFLVGNGNPTILASPPGLTFAATAGQITASKSVALTSAIAVTITSINYDVPWLSAVVTSGTLNLGPNTPGSLAVTASATTLGAGTYTGHLSLIPDIGTPTVITATLTVSAGGSSGVGTIAVDQSSFNFQYPDGALASTVTISAGTSGQQAFNVTVASQGNWLRFAASRVPAGTYNNVQFGQFPVAVDTTVAANLPAGTYPGSLALINPANANDVTMVNLTLTVSSSAGAPAAVSASPAALSFTASPGSASQSQFLTLISTSTAPVQLNVTSFNGAFFSISGAGCAGSPSPSFACSFVGTQTFTITVNPANLINQGKYSAGLQFQSGSASTTVFLTLNLNAPVTGLTVNPASLSFTALAGGAPQTQTVAVNVPGSATVQTTLVSTNGAFFTVASGDCNASPATNATCTLNGSQTLYVTITPALLNAGAYNGNIVLQSGSSAVSIPISVVVASGTAPLTLSPTSFSFNTTVSGPNPAGSLTVTVPISTLSYSVSASTTDGGTWLTILPSGNFTGNQTFTVNANQAGLAAGTYTGSISLTTSGAVQTIPVTFVVAAPPAPIVATPATLTFSAAVGQQVSSQNVTISTTSAAAVTIASITSDAPSWLSAATAGGASSVSAASPLVLTVTANAGTLAAGSYTGHITVRTAGGTTASVTVNIAVTAGSTITADRSSLLFTYPNSSSVNLTVQSTDASLNSFNLIVNAPQNWLRVGTRGNGAYVALALGLYTVSVDPTVAASLQPGVYTATLTLASAFPPLNPTIIAVTLVVGTGTGTNLSRGKSATQSSTLSGYPGAVAASAVDGNTDGGFFNNSVTHTNADANAWWQVDLGSSAAVNSVVLWNRTDCCSNRLSDYWVFVSDTPFLATDTPATLQGRANTFNSHQTTMPNPSATVAVGFQGRFVRIQLSGTNNLSLAEVQVFGTGGIDTNISRGKVATQSSTLDGYSSAVAGSAVDGNTDGGFFNGSVTHTNFDANAWWQVDLGSSSTVNSVILWNRTDCCSSRLSDFWVFVSDTPFLATDTPATLATRANTFSSHQIAAPNPSITIPFGVTGRYVRVQLSGTNNLSLAEVQVMGTGGTVSPNNLAANKTATQSSTLAGYPTAVAGSAVDGNTDGGFFNGSVTHTNIDTNAWWQVDLGTSSSISSVVVWNRTDCCSSRLNDYWVFVSDTPFLATDTPATLQNRAGTVSSHQTTTPSPSSTISIPAQGRYVRVQLSGINNLSLAEVQVFGQ